MAKSNVLQIGYQGWPGAFTQRALQEYMTEAHPAIRYRDIKHPDFDAVVRSFNQGKLDGMMLGTENNNSGDVHAMTLLMPEMHGMIVGEHFLAVNQCLLVKPGTTRQEIKKVFSQRPALDQCRHNIEREGWVTAEWVDTALAARHVSKSGDPTWAAIASPYAAEEYNLKNLGPIADNRINYTRFLHIVPPGEYARFKPAYDPDQKYVTTMVVQGTFHKPKNQGISFEFNMFEIRRISIPTGGFTRDHYIVEIEAHTDDPRYREYVRKLSERGIRPRVIGCYPMKVRPV